MKKQQGKNSKEKTITNSNFFVMERPSEMNENSLIIKTDEFHKEESKIEELLTDSFYDVVLNVSDRLTSDEYKHALRIVTPAFAAQLFAASPEKIHEIVQEFMVKEKNKKVLAFFESIPEDISKLEFVVRLNFNIYYRDKVEKGLNEAIKIHKFFLDDMEEIYYTLPVCFAFNLIDFLNDMENSKKKPSTKSK